MTAYYPPAAPAPAPNDPTAPAFRVASAIGVVKWIAVALYSLFALVAIVGGAASGSGGYAVMAIFFGLIGAGLLALVTWVMFGWAQHTLGMLATIARNTNRH